jgi:ABC-type Fe3+ transport system substrate-binding protein
MRLSPCRIAACIGAALLLSGAAHAAEWSPALTQLIVAAQKEGKLSLEWGAGILGGTDGVKEMAAGMNALFGTGVVARFTPGASLPETVNKVIIAQGAGRPSPTDAVIGTNQYAAELVRTGVSLAVDWVALLPQRITPDSVEAQGTALRVFTTLPGGIVYNATRAPMKPTTLADLLRPEWKGKIASTPYASSWELLSASDVWGDRALDFAKQLSSQLAGLMRCSELERVASAEFLAFAMDCSGREWVELKRKGAPVEHTIPADFAAQRFYYLAIPANATNPNAAKLFAAFLSTPQGQKLIWKYTDTDLHTYPESQLAPEIRDYEKRGVTFRQFTIPWHLAHPEALEGQHKAVRLLSGG